MNTNPASSHNDFCGPLKLNRIKSLHWAIVNSVMVSPVDMKAFRAAGCKSILDSSQQV